MLTMPVLNSQAQGTLVPQPLHFCLRKHHHQQQKQQKKTTSSSKASLESSLPQASGRCLLLGWQDTDEHPAAPTPNWLRKWRRGWDTGTGEEGFWRHIVFCGCSTPAGRTLPPWEVEALAALHFNAFPLNRKPGLQGEYNLKRQRTWVEIFIQKYQTPH